MEVTRRIASFGRANGQHFVQRRRADIRDYLNEDTEFPGDRLFRDAPYTLSPGYRALLDDAIAYASARVAGAAGRREQRRGHRGRR